MKTLLLAALGGVLLAAPATAQTAAQPVRTQIVNYADLDLRSQAGQAALDRRLRAAAHAACGTASSANPKGQNEVRRCRAETLERASIQRARAVSVAVESNATILSSR